MLIGIDGLRPDALAATKTPTIDALRRRGAFSDQAFAGDITISGPGWTSLLTGVWRDKHGVDTNALMSSQLLTTPTICARVESHSQAAHTVALLSWAPLGGSLTAGCDLSRVFGRPRKPNDRAVVAAAIEALGADDPTLLFVHLGGVDDVGHRHGFHPEVSAYRSAIEASDRHVASLTRALERRPEHAEEDWLIVITTDHGGTIDGAHGFNVPVHRRIFMLLAGDAARGPTRIPGQVGLVDVVPTVLSHLKVPWRVDPRLQGRDLLATVNPPAPPLGELLVNGSAELGRAVSVAGVDVQIDGWLDPGGVTQRRRAASNPAAAGSGATWFSTANANRASLHQWIDLVDHAVSIDRGALSFVLAGRLDSQARLSADFHTERSVIQAPRAAFFRDREMMVYDPVEKRVIRRESLPAGLGLPVTGPDAAFSGPGGTVDLVSGDAIVRLDVDSRTVLSRRRLPSRRPVVAAMALSSGGWAAIGGDGLGFVVRAEPAVDSPLARWPREIDAALGLSNEVAVLFSRSHSLRWLRLENRPAEPPQPLSWQSWPGLPSAGVDAAAMVRPRKTPTLGSATLISSGYSRHSKQDLIPRGTRWVLVELELSPSQGSHPVADDLSFKVKGHDLQDSE